MSTTSAETQKTGLADHLVADVAPQGAVAAGVSLGDGARLGGGRG